MRMLLKHKISIPIQSKIRSMNQSTAKNSIKLILFLNKAVIPKS